MKALRKDSTYMEKDAERWKKRLNIDTGREEKN